MNLTVTDIVALITAIVVVYKAVTLTPTDRTLVEATALDKMDEMVERAINRGLKLDQRIDTLEEEARIMAENTKKAEQAQITELKIRDDRITLLEKEVNEIKDWAERLVHQVQSLGHKPVAKVTVKPQ